MADEPITDVTYASQLKQIQSQLAVLETSYANMTRTYYDMFYNTTPMDITLQIYNDDGVLETITVPNRAKASTSTLTYNGSPSGVKSAALGTILLDTTTGNLWYESIAYDVNGWVQLANHKALSDEYLKKNGNGELLTDLSANNISQGQLEVAYGGTGASDVRMNGILKMVPEYTDDQGKVTKAHIEVATVGKDYLNSATLSGMIVFFPSFKIPAGYIPCDGTACERFRDGIEVYNTLYLALTNGGLNIPDWAVYYNEDGTVDTNKFRVPNLGNYFIRCTTNELERLAMTLQEDGIPNFKGTFSAEITGAMKALGGNEDNFTGAIQVALDDDGNFKQVDGKSSAPSGSYDYLINLNPQTYDDVCARIYQDGLNEVRVKNIALVPAIKY